MIHFEFCHEISGSPYAHRESESLDSVEYAIATIKELERNLEGTLTCNITIGNESNRQAWESISKQIFQVSRRDGHYGLWSGRDWLDLKTAKRKIKSVRAFYKI